MSHEEHAVECNIQKALAFPEYLGAKDCSCDGYHTFDELYDHRITLFIALCRKLSVPTIEAATTFTAEKAKEVQAAMRKGGVVQVPAKYIPAHQVWRSHQHADGSIIHHWSVLGIDKEPGKQITYHIPLTRWGECDFAETLDRAPEWDGHTSADVLERIKAL